MVHKFISLSVLTLALLFSGLAAAQGFEFHPWRAGRTAPVQAAADLNGHVWRLDALEGRAVLINFGASR